MIAWRSPLAGQIQVMNDFDIAKALMNIAQLDRGRCHAWTPFSRATVVASSHARPTRVQLLRARKNPTMISTAASTQVIGLDASNGIPNALVFGSSPALTV